MFTAMRAYGAAKMVQITPLWASDDLSVHRFDHPPEHDDRSFDNVAASYAASFVEQGEYLLQLGEGRWRVRAGDILLMHPGMRYRASAADGAFNDVGLTVRYLSACADDFDAKRTWERAQE